MVIRKKIKAKSPNFLLRKCHVFVMFSHVYFIIPKINEDKQFYINAKQFETNNMYTARLAVTSFKNKIGVKNKKFLLLFILNNK